MEGLLQNNNNNNIIIISLYTFSTLSLPTAK